MAILAMEAQALGLDRGCSRVACSFVRMALYGSSAMLAFNHCVVAFFETRNPDISSISVWEVYLVFGGSASSPGDEDIYFSSKTKANDPIASYRLIGIGAAVTRRPLPHHRGRRSGTGLQASRWRLKPCLISASSADALDAAHSKGSTSAERSLRRRAAP